MDDNRFDALTKALITGVGRRRMVSGLLGGTLVSLLAKSETEARTKKAQRHRHARNRQRDHDRDRQQGGGRSADRVSAEKKKKKKKTICHQGETIKVAKKAVKAHLGHGDTLGACSPSTPPPPPPPSLCPEEPFLACMQPAIDAMQAEIERCRPECDPDPEAASCQTCLEPAVATFVEAVQACGAEVCTGGLGPAEGTTRQGTVQGHGAVTPQAAPVATCKYNELQDCYDIVNASAAACAFGVAVKACVTPPSCAAALAACAAVALAAYYACLKKSGCRDATGKHVGIGTHAWCYEGNICCNASDTPCDGKECCLYSECERCVDGACKGCDPPKVCKGFSIAGPSCKCPVDLEECGDTCCQPGACRSDGTCACEVAISGMAPAGDVCEQRVYCNCNDTCYPNATECLAVCKATLGCFTGICRPAEAGECP